MSYLKVLILFFKYLTSKEKQKCKHLKVNPFKEIDNYCPDCGKQVAVEWFFIRCSDCSTKREGYHMFSQFIPKAEFCKRCGSNHYRIETREEVNFFELSFASFKMREIERSVKKPVIRQSRTKVWMENSYPVVSRSEYAGFNSLSLIPATVSS